jgi:porin
MTGRPRWSGTVLLAIGLAALVSGPVVAIAQTDAPATYTGDPWSRPRLTGDWWESRDWLAKRGVTLDLDLLQVLQGVATGGRDTGVAYDGLVNYELNLDTGKLGLWPGGFLKVKAFTGYGDTRWWDVTSRRPRTGIPEPSCR